MLFKLNGEHGEVVTLLNIAYKLVYGIGHGLNPALYPFHQVLCAHIAFKQRHGHDKQEYNANHQHIDDCHNPDHSPGNAL